MNKYEYPILYGNNLFRSQNKTFTSNFFFLLFLVFFLQHRIIIEMFYSVETLDQISATLTILWKFLMDRCAFTLGMNDILLI